MSFSLKYQTVARKPNPMKTINPLKQTASKTVTLQDRIDTLQKNAAWKKTIKAWTAKSRKINASRIPKVEMVALGEIEIDEDIQRQLDEKHCANKIANPDLFDEALLQTLQCIKTSKGKFKSIDGQHTASVIAALIIGGFFEGVDDWKDYKFSVQYVETDNLAFARRAFGILNGKGKKPQSAYQQLRNSVFIVRKDKDKTDTSDVEIERKVSIAEKNNCYPVEAGSNLAIHPGTFSNIATFKTLTDKQLSLACAWHNKYFHYESLHVSTFFIFRDIEKSFSAAKLPVSTKLQEELAALVQNLFGNLSQYQESVTEAHRKWTENRYGYKVPWEDDAYACALLQLYRKFSGSEKIPPSMLDRFEDIVDFFDEDILNLAP
jgi:hypothetical protein